MISPRARTRSHTGQGQDLTQDKVRDLTQDKVRDLVQGKELSHRARSTPVSSYATTFDDVVYPWALDILVVRWWTVNLLFYPLTMVAKISELFLSGNGFSVSITLKESNLAPLFRAVDHADSNDNGGFYGDLTITQQYCPYPVPEKYKLSLVLHEVCTLGHPWAQMFNLIHALERVVCPPPPTI